MKRFIFLAAILIGIAGLTASAETDVRQVTKPEVFCQTTDYHLSHTSNAVVADVLVYVTNIPECATVPVLVFDVVNKCTGFVWQIIKPPELITENQASVTNYIYATSRDWVTHRSHLVLKISFLHTSVSRYPQLFD